MLHQFMCSVSTFYVPFSDKYNALIGLPVRENNNNGGSL